MFNKKLSYLELKENYNLPEKISLNIENSGGYFVITSPDLPGLLTEAKDNKEIIKNVNDAILSYFDIPKKHAKIVFNSIVIDGYGTISSKAKNIVLA